MTRLNLISTDTVACPLSFFNETIHVPDQGWCYFAIYHCSFFFIFGIATLFMLATTLLNALYCCFFRTDKKNVVLSVKLTVAFFAFAVGIEISMLAFWLYLITEKRGILNPVTPVLSDIVTELPSQESMTPEPDGETSFSQTADECPICLESTSSSPWFTLANCGHRFHRACIVATGKNACPLCRGRVWKD
jgi:hypothetical protein